MTRPSGGALDGLRVLDLTRNAPGPFCAMLLGDYGADVVQIADPAHFGSGAPAHDAYLALRGSEHDALARNKRSLGLDLKSPAGRGVLHRLARDADVVVVEWRPGVAERLGADYPSLSALNPRIVYCALSGFGQAGPHALKAGHDLTYLGYSGVLSLMTDPSGTPIVPANLIADFGGAALAAFAILAAVTERSRTGMGQFIDAALTGAAAYLATDLAALAIHGLDQPRGGSFVVTGGVPFYGVYATRDGRHLTVAALEAKFYRRLCEAIGCPELAGAQWQRERYGEMREAFARAFLTRTQADWLEALEGEDVCVGPVVDFTEAARQGSRRPSATDVIPGAPILSRTPAVERSGPARPFADTDAILHELGCTASEIAAWRTEGVVR